MKLATLHDMTFLQTFTKTGQFVLNSLVGDTHTHTHTANVCHCITLFLLLETNDNYFLPVLCKELHLIMNYVMPKTIPTHSM
jgi:hypothetical protein